MLKLPLENVRVTVRLSFEATGSVLAGTIESRCTGAEEELEVDSPADPALVAALVRNARAGCFVESTLRDPVAVRASTRVNGASFEPDAIPKRPPRERGVG